MCSLAGAIDYREDLRTKEDILRNMSRVMTHRGPDQSGLYLSPHCALSHNRLCVIDPENGQQPMTRDGFTIVYNGELYNTGELRTELAEAGYTFNTRSDTEVLLTAFLCWGEDCVLHLNGIYAFAIWDKRTERLFLARDRMGVKPLFYAVCRNSLLFASELKGLLAHPDIPAQIDREGIYEIMLLGPGRTPGCGVFKDIRELPPAGRGWFDREGLHTDIYWHLEPKEHRDSLDTTVETVRYLVTDAICRQLVSDVPVGTFLSGGLDSGIISAIAARELGTELVTFSLDYRNSDRHFQSGKFQPTSDRDYIPLLRDKLGVRNVLYTVENEALFDALFEAVDARDLPGMSDVDASLLLFCREIKNHVTVALSGECADELFGGYPWYRDKTIRQQAGFPWAQSTAYRAGFLHPELTRDIDPVEYVLEKCRRTEADARTLPGEAPLETRMKQMMRLNTDWFMQTLLDRKDRMSMHSALEVRVPFCDHRIAEYAYNVPWEWKDLGGYEKGLLRKAMEGLLPEEILWRKKSPYPKTHDPAYRALVADALRDVLGDSTAPLHALVRTDALTELLTADSPQPWYGQLMTTPQTMAYLLQVNYWMRKYKVEVV